MNCSPIYPKYHHQTSLKAVADKVAADKKAAEAAAKTEAEAAAKAEAAAAETPTEEANA